MVFILTTLLYKLLKWVLYVIPDWSRRCTLRYFKSTLNKLPEYNIYLFILILRVVIQFNSSLEGHLRVILNFCMHGVYTGNILHIYLSYSWLQIMVNDCVSPPRSHTSFGSQGNRGQILFAADCPEGRGPLSPLTTQHISMLTEPIQRPQGGEALSLARETGHSFVSRSFCGRNANTT